MKKTLWMIIPLLIVISMSCSAIPVNGQEASLAEDAVEKEVERLLGAQLSEPMSVYLPLTLNGFPPPPAIFGIETKEADESILESAQKAGVDWIRENALRWKDVQPTSSSDWDWAPLYEMDQLLIDASQNGLVPILIVYSTPLWAQKYAGSYCGPIAEDALDDFAYFLERVVARYSKSPFNVKYWELGNEPDVLWNTNENTPWGCWGEPKTVDSYSGGTYYAEMLKIAYPAIKGVDPEAQVLIGGLLMPCDPETVGDGGCPLDSKNGLADNFFEGILKAGGGNYFDIVAFHTYAEMSPTMTAVNPIELERSHPYWSKSGGLVDGKLSYLRRMMNQYGVNKPIMNTESAFLCRDCDGTEPTFIQAKSTYLTWLYAKGWAEGLDSLIWYTFDYPGWFNGSVLGENQTETTDAYQALSFMTTTLKYAEFKQELTGLPVGVEGFEFFVHNQQKVWILFSNDTVTHAVNLPTGTALVTDHLGNSLGDPAVITSVNVEPLKPVYITINR